jgi:hypothetical protein
MAALVQNATEFVFVCLAYDDVEVPHGLFRNIQAICELFDIECVIGNDYVYAFTTNLLFVQHIVRVCRLYYGVDMLCVPRENIDPVHLPEPPATNRPMFFCRTNIYPDVRH